MTEIIPLIWMDGRSHIYLRRMWINVPSPLQMMHHLHGQRVLAYTGEHPYRDKVAVVYPISGPIISFRLDRKYLSEGWNDD